MFDLNIPMIDDNCLSGLLTWVVCIAVFYWFIHPTLVSAVNTIEGFDETDEGAPLDELKGSTGNVAVGGEPIPDDNYFLDVGDPAMAIQHNLCSKSCCSPQWPPMGFSLKSDPFVGENKDKFVGSQIMCNNAYQDSGCLCMTKEQNDFINSRGGNH